MNTKTYVRLMRRVRVVCVVALVAFAAAAGIKLARHYCGGGSSITNPNAFTSAHVAADLRAVRH